MFAFFLFLFYLIQCKNIKYGGPEEDQLNMKTNANFIYLFVIFYHLFSIYLLMSAVTPGHSHNGK